ncbi:MAG TPA: hypothetical protein VF462_08180, partial [Micromonosporaceae bacterium]
MPDESPAVLVAAQLMLSTPAELGVSCEQAIEAARTLVDWVKSGKLAGVDLLDAYDEATAALDNAV